MELNWHASDLEVAFTQSRARSSLLNSVPNQRAYIVLKPKEENKIIPILLKILFYEFIITFLYGLRMHQNLFTEFLSPA